MDDADSGPGEVREIADPLRISRADEDDERSPVHDAPERKVSPAPRRRRAGLREPLGIRLERDDGRVGGGAERDLIRHGAGAGEGADELHRFAGLFPPRLLERGEDAVVHRVAEDAESVEDDRSPLRPSRRDPGPEGEQEEGRAEDDGRRPGEPGDQESALDEAHRPVRSRWHEGNNL